MKSMKKESTKKDWKNNVARTYTTPNQFIQRTEGKIMASTNQVQEVKADLHTHEEVCAIRYDGINARLARMEKIIMAVFAGIVFLLIKVLISLGGL